MGPARNPAGDMAASRLRQDRSGYSGPDNPNCRSCIQTIIIFAIMAVTISDNYQVKYTRKWGTLLQQHASRLDKYVSVMRDLSGKVVFLDQFGILDASIFAP